MAGSPLKHTDIDVDAEERLFGVFPYLAPRELELIYAPIAAEFSRATGEQVFFATNSTFSRFRDNLNREMYDIVFVQPFFYVEIADKFGYKPLAVRDEALPAIIVVRPGSKFHTLDHLRGGSLALPPESAAVSYLIKNHLTEHGLTIHSDVTISHHRSHATCMQQVLVGIVSACGTAPPALRFFEEKMDASLRVIEQTRGIPNSLFAVHPRVPESIRIKLRQNILAWQASEKGRAFLKSVKVNAFRKTSDNEYDVVRRLSKRFEVFSSR